MSPPPPSFPASLRHSLGRSLGRARLWGSLALVIALLALAGWIWDVPCLKSVSPRFVSLKPNTAFGLLASGLAVLLLSCGKPAKSRLAWAAPLATVGFLLGALTLGEYFFGRNFGIDQCVFRDLGDVGNLPPGRMPPITAFCQFLLGIALLVSTLGAGAKWRFPIVAALAASVIAVGGLTLGGYLTEEVLHIRWSNFVGMAIHSAVALMLLGGALLELVKSEGGLAWELDRPITAGFVAGIAIMLAAAAVSYSFTNRLLQSAGRVSHSQEVLKKVQEVISGVAELEDEQRGFLITGDEHLLESRGELKAALSEDLDAIRKLTAGYPGQQQRLDRLAPLIGRREEFAEKTIALRRQAGFGPAADLLATRTGMRLTQDISAILKEMRDEEYRLLAIRESESKSVSTTTFLLLPLGVILSLTILCSGLFFLNAGFNERTRAKLELQQSEARLGGIVNSAMDAIISIDAGQNIMLFNAAAEHMFQRPAAEVLGQSIEILIPQKFRSGHARHVENFGKTGVTSRSMGALGSISGVRANGEEFPIEASISQVEVGGQRIFTVILRDITERKRAEEALRESEERLQTVVENLTEGLVLSDIEGNLLHWNRAGLEMHGFFNLEEGRRCLPEFTRIFELSTLEGRVLDYDQWPLKRVIAGEPVRDLDLRIRRLDSNWQRIFSYGGSIVRDASGRPLAFLTITDITERKRAEHIQLENLRLEEQNRRVQEASRMKSEFLANMSHELRTPLNGILGFTEFLADEKPGPLNPKQKEYLADVHNSSEHLLQLINDVLDLAKVEAGKMEFHAETFGLAKAVDEACAILKGIATRKRVSLAWKVEEELSLVTLDRQKFKQVCCNLLANAVKFTDAGGSVDVRAVPREGGRFELRVQDTGIGIQKKDMERLFREFEQLESGSTRRFEGTGLGLALTKKLVEFQGGSIGVESEYGKGSTFFIVLPIVVTGEVSHA